MKKAIKAIAIGILITAATTLLAQNPPHPNGGNDPNSGGNTPVGGGAPIDGGISLLMLLGAAYGGKKLMTMKVKK